MAAAAGEVGWPAPAVAHFLRSGRDWAAVETFFRRLTAGEVGIDALGLSLHELPSPPLPALPTVAAGGAAAAAGPAAIETQLACSGAGAPQAQNSKRSRGPHDRLTFKVHLSYYGPAFRGWRWLKGEPKTLELLLRTRLHHLLSPTTSTSTTAGSSSSRGGGSIAAAAGAAGEAAIREAASGEAATTGSTGPQASNGPCGTKASSSSRGTAGGASGRGASKGCGTVLLSVAGRTDRGVHALGQVFSFYTWNGGTTPQDVQEALGDLMPGLLRAWHVERVPRSFHATFAAKWRRYLYLLPLRTTAGTAGTAGAAMPGASSNGCSSSSSINADSGSASADAAASNVWFDATAVDAAPDVDPARVDALLRQLEGRHLDYHTFARSTPPGKLSTCCLLRTRAWRCRLPDPQGTPVLAIELAGDRFLRRMVRVLVATAVREALPLAAWAPHLPRSTHPEGEQRRQGQGQAAGEATEAGAVASGLQALRLWPAGAGHEAGAAGADGAAAGSTTAETVQAAAAQRLGVDTEAVQAQDLDSGALLRVLATGDRLQSGPSAPAEGLCFVEAGYQPFPPNSAAD